MENSLAKKFTFASLLKFAIPNMIMMVSLSMYVIVDGMFVSRFLGTTALSAVNMIYPLICFEMAIAIMIATGGSAIVAKKMGEGKQKEAQKNLSFLIAVELLLGIMVSILGTIFLENIIKFLGVQNAQLSMAIPYAKILFLFAPAFFLQTAFQTFFVTAGKPTLGLVVTLLAGIANVIFDYIFMEPLQMGIAGAAIATGIGYCIPALTGLLFFFFAKQHPLHLVWPEVDGKVLLKSCTNGSSEMVTNLANAATTFLFNFTMMKFYGEDGVAAIAIILYVQYIFTALYFGYSNGIAPIISFKYGCGDKKQLKSIFKSSILILMVSSLILNTIVYFSAGLTFSFFAQTGSTVYEIALDGFTMYSISFYIMEIGIFASALFTALSDGKSSAIISFARTFIFIVGAILILPTMIGEYGIWLSVPFAEILGLIIATGYLIVKRKNFSYV